MPDPITLGHLLMLAGVALIVAAGFLAFAATRWRGPAHGRGTPGYARARTGRRKAVYAGILGLLLLAAGWLTPLRDLALT